MAHDTGIVNYVQGIRWWEGVTRSTEDSPFWGTRNYGSYRRGGKK